MKANDIDCALKNLKSLLNDYINELAIDPPPASGLIKERYRPNYLRALNEDIELLSKWRLHL